MKENTVVLCSTPPNTHGCRGFELELEIIDRQTAQVVGGESCSSCWQVGHDNGTPVLAVGTVVRLPEKFPHVKVWAGTGEGFWDWHENTWVEEFQWGDGLEVTWQNAQQWAGFCHNGLVSHADGPQPDSTLLSPFDLVVVP